MQVLDPFLDGHDVTIPAGCRDEAIAYLGEHPEIDWAYDWLHGDRRSDPPTVRAQARFVFVQLDHADAFQDRFEKRAGIVVHPIRGGLFVVSEDDTWVAGIYATAEAAALAPTVNPARLGELADSSRRGVGAAYVPITLDEVRAIASA